MQTNKQHVQKTFMKLLINVWLNARGLVNKKNKLNIMVEDIDPHIIGITESWANKDVANAELGLTGSIMFRRD